MSGNISTASVLFRPDPSQTTLSENQAFVDEMVGNAVSEATQGSSLLAMLGAGVVSRLTRLGCMSLGEGGALLSLLTRSGSSVVALANESATFAGLERGLHPSRTSMSFEKDWARAFINIGSLKLLGGISQGQSPILQHLLTDLGMVGGQQMGASLGWVERPQGNFMQQMVRAEGMNWTMKGGMALLHGLFPHLLSMENSMELALKSQEKILFSQGHPFPFLSEPAFAESSPWNPDGIVAQMSGQGEGPRRPPPVRIPRPNVSRTASPIPPLSTLGAGPAVPRPSTEAPRRVTLSLTPPAPTDSVEPMSNDQILWLYKMAERQPPELQVFSFARIGAELSHAGQRENAGQYFDYASSLIDALPDVGSLKGRAYSHLALEQARAGDQKSSKENFGRAMQEVNRLQEDPRRTREGTREAYGLVLTLAGDLSGAGRADTATQFLKIAGPHYQRVFSAQFPVGEDPSAALSVEAVMKWADQGQFKEALTLAEGMPEGSVREKTFLELGKAAARQGRIREAAHALSQLQDFVEKDAIRAEVTLTYGRAQKWNQALQNLPIFVDVSQRIRTSALLARALFQSGNTNQALALQGETARGLREEGENLTPERRAELSAVLASNAALWGDKDGHSRFYYLAWGDLEAGWEDSPPETFGEDARRALAEIVFGLHLANAGEKIGDLFKRVDPSTKSWVQGETALKLFEAGRSSTAMAWLSFLPEKDRSEVQKKIALNLSNMGDAGRALALADKIPDLGQRFDALWEIFSRHRGIIPKLPAGDPPGTKRPPPLLPTKG